MRKLDFHCHIYPAKIAEKARQSTGAFYGVECGDCTGQAEDLLARCDEAGIEACVIHSVATKPEQVDSINNFLLRVSQAHPGRFLPFGTVHQDTQDMGRVADWLCEHGFRGVKLHPDIQGVALNDPRLMPLYEACRGRLTVLFHAGDDRYSYSTPAEIIPVLEAFPDVTFVGAHLCGYHVWSDAVPVMAKRFDNLYVDCSSSSFAMGTEKFREYIAAYGYDRVLFGSDYPMWDPRTESRILEFLDLPQQALEDVFWNNAARLLNLK